MPGRVDGITTSLPLRAAWGSGPLEGHACTACTAVRNQHFQEDARWQAGPGQLGRHSSGAWGGVQGGAEGVDCAGTVCIPTPGGPGGPWGPVAPSGPAGPAPATMVPLVKLQKLQRPRTLSLLHGIVWPTMPGPDRPYVVWLRTDPAPTEVMHYDALAGHRSAHLEVQAALGLPLALSSVPLSAHGQARTCQDPSHPAASWMGRDGSCHSEVAAVTPAACGSPL